MTVQYTIPFDSPALDAFGRMRVSEPASIFDSQFQYDLQPLVWESITGAGGSVEHLPNESAARLLTTGAPNSLSTLQTYQYFRYQPQKSQMIAMTFSFGTPVSGVVKRVGQFDSQNGIFLEQDGSNGAAVVIRTFVSGEISEERVYQANWNGDKLQGFGKTRTTLDLSKSQILIIDYQWLGVGRVRVGVDIGGAIIYLHSFNHANVDETAYTTTMNLPLRYEINNSSGNVHSSMRAICSSVASEAGQQYSSGYDFVSSGSVVAANGSRTHLLSIQPKTTFNSIENRELIQPLSIDIGVTGNNPIQWELCLGCSISSGSTFADVNATYSGVQYNYGGVLSGVPPIVISSGFVATSASNRQSVERDVVNRFPITLDYNGDTRLLGRLSLIVTGLGGTSACYGAIRWRETR